MSTFVQSQTNVTQAYSFTPVRVGLLQRTCSCGQHTDGEGECSECSKKYEGTLHRAAINTTSAQTVPPIVHDTLQAPGKQLETDTRAFMESRFDHDFSGVRVHTDAKAAESARSVNALAYTVGRDVVFGQGQYAPGTMAGKRLLAHELTHTIQQGTSRTTDIVPSSRLQIGNASDAYEHEASSIASQVLKANTAQLGTDNAVSRHHQPVLQMQEDKPATPQPDKKDESEKPLIPIPVFDQLDPFVIVPDFIPGVGGGTFKLSYVKKAIDRLQGKRSGTDSDSFCTKFGMQKAQFGDVKGMCCRGTARTKDQCCTWKNVDILLGRCCTPMEFNYQGRCIKPKLAPVKQSDAGSTTDGPDGSSDNTTAIAQNDTQNDNNDTESTG